MKKIAFTLILAFAAFFTQAQKLIKLENTSDTIVVSETNILQVLPLTDSTASISYLDFVGNNIKKFITSVSADSAIVRSTRLFFISDSSVGLNAERILFVSTFDQGSSIINYANGVRRQKIINPSVSADSLINFINAR